MNFLNGHLILFAYLLGITVADNALTIEELNKKWEILSKETTEIRNEMKSLKSQWENSHSSICGEWTQYKDEKCVKAFDKLGTHTYDDAVMLCHKQSDGATLLSIHSKEENDFLSEFIFKTNKIVDNVWINAQRDKQNTNVFKWNDGSEFKFTNWENGFPKNGNNKCIQMHKEFDFFDNSFGKWTNTDCNKSNRVVCQKMQNWSFERLQKSYLQTRKSFSDSLHDLESNPIPIGFIYVQLPNQSEPSKVWPNVQWNDVSNEYAGLFFRVLGGDSEHFSKIQEGDSPRLTNVDHCVVKQWDGMISCDSSKKLDYNHISVTSDGNKNAIYSGAYSGGNWLFNNFISFTISKTEVRPKNAAMKIWKRI